MFGCALATLALAEEGTVTEQEFWETPPVVLSVTQLAQPKDEAPAAVTIITRAEIAAMGVRSIPDLFRRVAGVTVAYENASNPVINYQGLNSNLSARMQVLVDGRSVYNPFFGGVLWENLPLEVDDIERIEVIRGPNAAIDGANAFLATISITTRHAAEDRGGYVKGRLGTDGIRDGYARYGGAAGAVSYRLAGGYRQDHGLDTRDDDKHVRYLSGRADWNLSPTQRLTAAAGLKDADLGQGYALGQFNVLRNPFEACFPSHTRHLKNTFGQLRYDLVPSPDRQSTLQFYYERVDSDAEYARLPPCPGLLKRDEYRTERFDLEWRSHFSLNPDTRLLWGLGGRLDRVDNQDRTERTRFVNRVANRSGRVFGHLEWRINDRWLVNTGAMWERNTLTGDNEISPRFAVHYTIADHHTLRAGIARGIRTPSFAEADWTSEIIANVGDVEAESIIATELAYLGQWPAYRLSLDARYYHNRVKNLITLALSPVPGLPRVTHVNRGEADLHGLELQLTWRPTRATRLGLAYALTAVDSDDPLGFSRSNPRHIADVFIVHDFTDTLQGSLTFNYASPMEWLTFGTRVPSTRFLDVRLAKRFQGGGAPVEVALKIDNVLGDQTTYRDINEVGRSVFVEAAIGF